MSVVRVAQAKPVSTATVWYRAVTVGARAVHAFGPFCPSQVCSGVAGKTSSTDTSAVGMGIESGKAHALTGQFMANLPMFCGSSNWQLFDGGTGKVTDTDADTDTDTDTDTQVLFEAVAVPDGPPSTSGAAMSIRAPVTTTTRPPATRSRWPATPATPP